MQPIRAPGPPRPPLSPPAAPPSPPSHSPHHAQHTSLPPIRHLYLPHPLPTASSSSQLPYPYSPQNVPAHHEIYGTAESDQDDPGEHGPPKKRRRRQALSCTECKRRKIKCDRSQPCAPCTRRGEQDKCQWHVVEPIEKYVTRAEYNELKARFDHLQTLVDRILVQLQTPIASGTTTTYAGSPLQPYMHHPPLMPPPKNYPQPHVPTGETTAFQGPQVHRYDKGEDSGATRSMRKSGSSTTVRMAADTSPITANARPSVNKSPASTVAVPKSSPLSLANITSPFTPTDPAVQSKNCRAQTFILGECLRPRFRVLRDPVPHTLHLRHQHVPRKPTYLTEILHSFPIHLRRASVGSVISPDLCIIQQTESNERYFSGCIIYLYTWPLNGNFGHSFYYRRLRNYLW